MDVIAIISWNGVIEEDIRYGGSKMVWSRAYIKYNASNMATKCVNDILELE